jgi:hypothetical protein
MPLPSQNIALSVVPQYVFGGEFTNAQSLATLHCPNALQRFVVIELA